MPLCPARSGAALCYRIQSHVFHRTSYSVVFSMVCVNEVTVSLVFSVCYTLALKVIMLTGMNQDSYLNIYPVYNYIDLPECLCLRIMEKVDDYTRQQAQ